MIIPYTNIRLLVCALGVSCSLITSANGYLLNAYEQAIGQWDLTLVRKDKKDLFESILFPPTVLENNQNGTTTIESNEKKCVNNDDESERQGRGILPSVSSRLVNQRKIKCQLNLEPDGSFVLTPKVITLDDDDDQMNVSSDGTLPPSISKKLSRTTSLPLKGKWRLQPNPYCITDRHYDELCLISNPRVKKFKHIEGRIQRKPQTAVFELRCKVWGRYGNRSIRQLMGYAHGRSKGRLTHGTVLLIRASSSYDDQSRFFPFQKRAKGFIPKWRRRIVCGTFHGKPPPNSPTFSLSSEDNDYDNDYASDFDYDDDYDEDF